MGLGIGKEPVWCPLAVERSVGESNIFTERKRKKKTNKTLPWIMVGRGGEPKWKKKGGVGGRQGAWVLVNWGRKGHP